MSKLINYYFCSSCDVEWEDEWDCECDDECPECGTPHSPFRSEEEDTEEEDKIFEIPVKFTFEGFFKIKASSKEEAEENAEKHCGMIRGDVQSTLNDEDVDWNFPIHPDMEIL